LGRLRVKGRSLVPKPAARIMAFIVYAQSIGDIF